LRKIISGVDEIFHFEYFEKIGGLAGWLGCCRGYVVDAAGSMCWPRMNIIPLFDPSFNPFGIG
jgi:hypothetical protein